MNGLPSIALIVDTHIAPIIGEDFLVSKRVGAMIAPMVTVLLGTSGSLMTKGSLSIYMSLNVSLLARQPRRGEMSIDTILCN